MPQFSPRQCVESARKLRNGLAADNFFYGKLVASVFAGITLVSGLVTAFIWVSYRPPLDSIHGNLQRMVEAGVFAALALLALSAFIGSTWVLWKAFRKELQKIDSSQQQTRAIIETTLDAIITIDSAGYIQSINPATERMFTQTPKQLIGRNISVIIPQRLFFHDASKIATGTVVSMGQRQGYYPFPIEVTLSEMSVRGQRQFVLIVRDITERKRSEETLKQIGLGVTAATGVEFVKSLAQELSRALHSEFAFILELNSLDGEQGGILTLAQRGEIHSSGPYQLKGTACGTVFDKGYRAFIGGANERFRDDPLLTGLHAESFVATPLLDHHNRTVGVMGVIDRRVLDGIQIIESTLQIFATRAAAEIERARFEEDLAAEKDRLAVTLRSIGDGFITTDKDGRVLMLNKVAERLTGWSQLRAAGQPLGMVFHLIDEKTRRRCDDDVATILETGSADDISGPTIIVSQEGVERLIETNAAPIRDHSNRMVGVVLVFRDVTERQHTEEERRKAEKLESLGVAAGGIAHDFNNLLTAILGNLSIALMTLNENDPLVDRLSAAKKASLRAQELAQQLLTFAKGGSPIKQTASIGQLVRDTVSFSLRGSKIRSEFAVPDNLWPADIDAGQISQVIQNLTINADQAMPAGGTLRVACANFELTADNARLDLPAGRYVTITVRDEGIGIAQENIKKIFDPYFTTKPKGSGLGLATSYSIVKNHNGVIDVVSQPGAGTTFYLFLPASDNVPVTEPVRVPTPEPVPRSARVLVLDDEEAICALVTYALQDLGYEVTETYDALTAIAKYDEALKNGCRYDLVISDLTIPGGMGGLEAVRRLREIDPNVKAIVSSGYANDPVMSQFREHGFCAMIAKPYEISALCRVVAEVLAATESEKVIPFSMGKRMTA